MSFMQWRSAKPSTNKFRRVRPGAERADLPWRLATLHAWSPGGQKKNNPTPSASDIASSQRVRNPRIASGLCRDGFASLFTMRDRNLQRHHVCRTMRAHAFGLRSALQPQCSSATTSAKSAPRLHSVLLRHAPNNCRCSQWTWPTCCATLALA